MRNNNYLSLINFKVKTQSSETFFLKNEYDVGCSNFFGRYNTQHGVLTPQVTPCFQETI